MFLDLSDSFLDERLVSALFSGRYNRCEEHEGKKCFASSSDLFFFLQRSFHGPAAIALPFDFCVKRNPRLCFKVGYEWLDAKEMPPPKKQTSRWNVFGEPITVDSVQLSSRRNRSGRRANDNGVLLCLDWTHRRAASAAVLAAPGVACLGVRTPKRANRSINTLPAPLRLPLAASPKPKTKKRNVGTLIVYLFRPDGRYDCYDP